MRPEPIVVPIVVRQILEEGGYLSGRRHGHDLLLNLLCTKPHRVSLEDGSHLVSGIVGTQQLGGPRSFHTPRYVVLVGTSRKQKERFTEGERTERGARPPMGDDDSCSALSSGRSGTNCRATVF